MSLEKNNRKGILYVLIGMAVFSIQDASIKWIFNDTALYELYFGRTIIAFLLLLIFMKYKNIKLNLKTHYPFLTTLRVLLFFLGFSFFYISLTFMTLSMANALFFSSPFFISIFSKIFLKEKIGIRRFSAIVMGFIGMLIIIRPGMIEVSLGVYMILASSFLWALVIIITKKLSKDESALTILSYQYIFMFLISFVFAIFNWQSPSLETLIYLFLAGLSGTIFHLTSYQAYKIVDVSLVQPYFFLVLVFASILGYFVFNEIPDIYTWIGAGVIFIGILIISVREIQINKNIVNKNLNADL